MQTGVISQENFSQVLRSLSQKRKHGVLEIQYAEKRVDVSFVQGRIVEATLFDVNPVEEVVGILRSAGMIKGELESGWEVSYDALFQAFASRDPGLGVVEEKVFARAVKHRVLDLLYGVVAKEGGYYNFKTMMVECSKHFAPSISVGQLLLDVVALQSEGHKFSETFKEGVILKRDVARAAQMEGSSLPEEELAIFEALSEDLSLEELRLKSLLSIYHFQESLRSLHTRGLIAVSEVGVTSEKLLGTNFLESLDSSIDSVFASVDEATDQLETLGEDELEEEESVTARARSEQAEGEELEEGDEEFGEEDEDGEYEEVKPNLKVRLGLISYRLLNKSWVPHTLAVIGLLVGVVVPFLFWGPIFKPFGY